MGSELTVRGKYAFFWGQWPSNWQPSSFTINGKTFNCVEQWMMWSKARLFGDNQAEKLIMSTDDPAEQKDYGRRVKDYDDNKWSNVRYQIVLEGVVAKYRQNEDLKKLLFDTGDLVFVEASPDDKIWGIGLRASDKDAASPGKWRGLNLLGKATTEARTILRAEEAPK